MGIIIEKIPIKVHYFIYIVEYYHKFLQQLYFIITTEILGIKSNLVMQMFFKAINNLVGPNGLVTTLLFFDANLKITK